MSLANRSEASFSNQSEVKDLSKNSIMYMQETAQTNEPEGIPLYMMSHG